MPDEREDPNSVETVGQSEPPDWWNSMDALGQELWMHSVLNRYFAQSKPAEPLFHYTSPDAFWKILDSGQIWLTNAAYLNDQEELTYPIRLARTVLNDAHLAESDDKLRDFLVQVSYVIEAHASFKNWYVASFSADGNLLSQWRAYCKSGGYSIGLRGSAVSDHFANTALYRISAIIYDEDEQLKRIRGVVERFVGVWKELRTKHADVAQDEFNRRIGVELGIALSEHFIFIKRNSFHEEREWRVAKYKIDGDAIAFRERNGTLVPYLASDLRIGGLLPINEVWVSPLGEQELEYHAALEALLARKYLQPDKLIRTPGYRLRF